MRWRFLFYFGKNSLATYHCYTIQYDIDCWHQGFTFFVIYFEWIGWLDTSYISTFFTIWVLLNVIITMVLKRMVEARSDFAKKRSLWENKNTPNWNIFFAKTHIFSLILTNVNLPCISFIGISISAKKVCKLSQNQKTRN